MAKNTVVQVKSDSMADSVKAIFVQFKQEHPHEANIIVYVGLTPLAFWII